MTEIMKKETVYKLFSKIPTIETERLVLRRMKPSDCHDMYEYASNPDVTRYLLWEPHKSWKQSLEYLEYLQTRYRVGDFYDWAVVDKKRSKMIGTCGFTSLDFGNNAAEVGYVLNPAYWGRGIAPEALKRVLYFAFMELNVHRVEARYMVGNDRSRRVMEKCGMTYEGVRRSSMYVKGSYRDIGICSILSEEYILNR
ncbi:MAG: GNAT family N-acetyltransferase [Clostridiales bacterium]|nr:GNAT family N-acetyltransferase [Clostridiales bacterium]